MKAAKFLLFSGLLWSTSGLAQSTPTSASLERCLNLGENDLRGELRGVTRQFFDAELGAVDLPRMVENKWLELGLPNLLENEVNRAINEVKNETGNWKRFTSYLLPAQATELAEQIAGRVFTSETLQKRLEILSSEVAADFTDSFTSVAARSASAATECVQSYLGNAYGMAAPFLPLSSKNSVLRLTPTVKTP